MRRLFRILHWAARSRYWQRKYQRAQAKCDELIEQLQAELWRQVERGDMYTSAAVMGSRQMYGIAPRVGPATKTVTTQAAPINDPLAGMSGSERMEFQTLWLPDAIRAGVTERAALQSFRIELANRKESVM